MIVHTACFLIACIFVFGQSFCMDELIPLIVGEPHGEGRQVVRLHNPCYPRSSEIEHIDIGNGDLVNFACAGPIGWFIRSVSKRNHVPNPRGSTHTGVALIDNPQYVWRTIFNLTPNEQNRGFGCTIEEKTGKWMLEKIRKYYGDDLGVIGGGEIWRPFVFEANTTLGQLCHGVHPHTQIRPFVKALKYDGNVDLRSINFAIPIDFSRRFMGEHVGRPYETFSTCRELFHAARNGNLPERTEKVFCSELASAFYIRAIEESDLENKGELIARFRNSSNILPERFCDDIGEYDLLEGLASTERALKVKFAVTE